MKIYRLENEKGLGPYTVDWDQRWELHKQHGRGDNHKGLLDIIGDLDDYYDWFSACPTIESLKVWFEGFWDDILEAGFRLVEVEVDDMDYASQGLPQVAYHKDSVIEKRVL